MARKYLAHVPKTLQEDFVDQRVLPLIGAGFSKNGVLPAGSKMPDWDELGKRVATYLDDYEYKNAVDALSLFESEFSRVKLVELLAKELFLNDAKPGDAHRSLCSIFFDTICTTNFDFLLEQSLIGLSRPYATVVSEDRLPIDTRERTKIVKLHGDFNHPDRMVLTENDYDVYLEKNKVLATYVSNLFITKTLLLVGYSFDDVDIRSLWQIVNSRLGRLSCPAYAVMVGATPYEVSRFARRNVKVINLRGRKADYPRILADFFSEIKDMIDQELPERLVGMNEDAREELRFSDADSRLCFISAPYERISFLKELLYPILSSLHVTPITADEVIAPGDSWMAKIETLLKKSSVVVVDVSGSSLNVTWELGLARQMSKKVLLVGSTHDAGGLPFDSSQFRHFRYSTEKDNEDFIEAFGSALRQLLSQLQAERDEREPERLMAKGEYSAAVISAFRRLEEVLRSRMELGGSRTPSLREMLRTLSPTPLIEKVIGYLGTRNNVVHGGLKPNRRDATEIVRTVGTLIFRITEDLH